MKAFIKSLVPACLDLPLRYYMMRVRGRLDTELGLIPHLLQPSKRRRAVDVGANIGFYSYALSKAFHDVEAFEPMPCTAMLKAVGGNICVHDVALSDREGVDTMYAPPLNGADNFGLASLCHNDGRAFPVKLRTLDDYRFADVDFLKIDVEGHERQVIEGGMGTIKHCRPLIFIEIEQRHLHEPMANLFHLVFSLGYRGSFYSDGWRDISDFSYETHQRPFLDDVYSVGYINNFLFRPE